MRPLLTMLAPLALAACATSGPALDSSVDPSVDAVVEMTPSLAFSPTPLRISAGDTVEFRNVSAFAHTVSTVPDDAAERATVQLPAGATAFDSGPIAAGDIYRVTFDVPGTYRYFCDPHHGADMIGTIVVESVSGNSTSY